MTSQNKLTLVDKLTGIISALIPIATIPFYRDSTPSTSAQRVLGTYEALIKNPNITPYIGNFPDTFMVSVASGFIGDCIQSVGLNRKNRFLQKIGRYFPEISAGAISVYSILGESILPQIFPGTADFRDIPAALFGALTGYCLAKLGRKSGLNKKCFELIERVN